MNCIRDDQGKDVLYDASGKECKSHVHTSIQIFFEKASAIHAHTHACAHTYAHTHTHRFISYTNISESCFLTFSNFVNIHFTPTPAFSLSNSYSLEIQRYKCTLTWDELVNQRNHVCVWPWLPSVRRNASRRVWRKLILSKSLFSSIKTCIVSSADIYRYFIIIMVHMCRWVSCTSSLSRVCIISIQCDRFTNNQ